MLSEKIRAGLEQVVILGAGFDARALRFSEPLRTVPVFEMDMPEVLALRSELLLQGEPTSATAVPIDFEHEDLGQTLRARGYSAAASTLFLWEGVTYHLLEDAVAAVLSHVAAQSAPGSSILFDYVTRAFVDGDHTGYGARRLAGGWRRLGNVNRFGVDDIAGFVRPLGLTVQSDVDAGELERRHLSSLPGPRVRACGCMRIAHVTTPGAPPKEEPWREDECSDPQLSGSSSTAIRRCSSRSPMASSSIAGASSSPGPGCRRTRITMRGRGPWAAT